MASIVPLPSYPIISLYLYFIHIYITLSLNNRATCMYYGSIYGVVAAGLFLLAFPCVDIVNIPFSQVALTRQIR